MLQEDTRKAAMVMLAFSEGKTIQYRGRYDERAKWVDINPLKQICVWDWYNIDYRIKPKPHYRPFNSAEEVMKAIKEHGDWVKYADSPYVFFKITRIEKYDVYLEGNTRKGLPYKDAFALLVFVDKTPFGVMEE